MNHRQNCATEMLNSTVIQKEDTNQRKTFGTNGKIRRNTHIKRENHSETRMLISNCLIFQKWT